MAATKDKPTKDISFEEFKAEVLADYRTACLSREMSLLGRKEVLTGKAKFGIFGDGKEIAQIALAKQFKEGDFRSGYYRDQTIMMAAGLLKPQEFFAQLYAHTDVAADPSSAGRQMNGHYATRSLNEDGSWKDLTAQKNSSADVSPTASQMPRLLGLAYASKFYKENKGLKDHKGFSKGGNEVAFGTIGDASTSEGMFWETVNAANVLQVPMVLSIWDDGYGISVPREHQTATGSISQALAGMQRNENVTGMEIIKAKGWDFAGLCDAYEQGVALARQKHIPVLIHVEEVTQPQGHSTSGSHERYKSEERLKWEDEFDPIRKMGEWMVEKAIATQEELDEVREATKNEIKDAKKAAWDGYLAPLKEEKTALVGLLQAMGGASANAADINAVVDELNSGTDFERRVYMAAAKKALRHTAGESNPAKQEVVNWVEQCATDNFERYSSTLYSESDSSALKVTPVAAEYADDTSVDGREILRDNFDKILANHPEVLIYGEDSGKIGGVNQGLEGLQEKYGELRVFDTGIRECTIIGQGIGLAMRGLRPIAEIQYLDYILYAIQIISDDLATLQYRSKGGQKAPLIIRTRGHRLEGIWHSGSHMGAILHLCRGVHVCVPRNMTQAAGFYNTLLASDDAGIVVESLNGYRLKEKQPSNLGEFRVPLGVPEVMKEGSDVTLITYGSMVRMVEAVAQQLETANISAEVIDVQTLLPFDINHTIVESLKKTNRVIFIDEDVPGGASAFMMQKVLEEQGGYQHLDSQPVTVCSQEHRPAYGSDGDYFSKSNNEDIFDAAYNLMHESDPAKYPALY